MLEQAQAELPNECCGLLAGRVVDGIARVEMRYPLVNELASPIEYSAEARSLFAAFKDMRARDLVELAIYHSHPTTAPIPSKTDRDRNFFGTEMIFLIIGLAVQPPLVRAWRLHTDAQVEFDWQLVD
jgi:[CysO sulfur-carrier protein]-S-L-cysteine hydrolase